VAPPAGTAWPQRANPSEIRADTRSGPTPQAIVNQNSRFGTLDAGEYFLMAGRRTRLLRVRGMIAVRVSEGTPNPQAVADKLTTPGAALDAFQLKLGAALNRTFVFEVREGLKSKAAAVEQLAAGDVASSDALTADAERNPDVAFAAPVFTDGEGDLKRFLTDEIIVRLRNPADERLLRTRLVGARVLSVRRVGGTLDEFVVKVANLRGSRILAIANRAHALPFVR